MQKFFLSVLAALLLVGASHGLQAQCDTCSAPWGPEQFVAYHGLQPQPSFPPGCEFSLFISYQTRMCNGQVQFRITHQSLANTSSGCQLTCWQAGSIYIQGIKQIVLDLGVQVTNLRPSACYAAVEVGAPTTLQHCFGAEWGTVSQWMVSLPCDSSGCCRTTLTPDPVTGQVYEHTEYAVPCPPTAAPTIPTQVKIRCMKNGVWHEEWVPVLPGQPVTCESVCQASGAGSFLKKDVVTVRNTPEIKLAPNPVSDILAVTYDLESALGSRLVLRNVEGKTVLDRPLTEAQGTIQVPVRDLPAGMYICNIYTPVTIFTSNSVLIKH